MENTILEAVKLFMAIIGMIVIIYLLIKNMMLRYKVEYLNECIDQLEIDYEEYEQSQSDIKISYENQIDKLEEVINNLEKNK